MFVIAAILSNSEVLIDKVAWRILAALSKNHNGLRYVELRNQVEASDSAFVSRVGPLKAMGFLEIEARSEEASKNYIVYKLTPKGEQIVKKWNIPELLAEAEKHERDSTERSTSRGEELISARTPKGGSV
jgi:DNA-binding MarR family transcriptional regulator